MADAGSGDQGVLHVGVEGVLVRGDRGDAALGVVGRGFRYFTFSDHGNRAVSRRLQGKGEPGNAAADHQKVALQLHASPRLG